MCATYMIKSSHKKLIIGGLVVRRMLLRGKLADVRTTFSLVTLGTCPHLNGIRSGTLPTSSASPGILDLL